MSVRSSLLAALVCLLPLSTPAAQQSDSTRSDSTVLPRTRRAESRADPAFRVYVPRVERAPRIDGLLDELWRSAGRLSGFTEVEPSPGATPQDSTVGYVAYDRENLYVAVVA